MPIHQTDYNGKCYISHSECYEDTRAVADLESRFPYLNGKVRISQRRYDDWDHTGPGTVALFFWGDTQPNNHYL